jgi:protoheme IX farnesyltransferase
MTIAPTALAHESARGWLSAFIALFKIRVVMLLLLAALGGAMLAGLRSASDLALLILTGAMSAMGASALNQYIERHKDGYMKRTRRRPLVTGEVDPRAALAAGSGMVLLASGIAWVAGNLSLAIWLAVGAFIYVGVYTIWLKPRSVLNVVIGGAAGSAAVISGGAAVGNGFDLGVWLLAGLLFAWSPTHFWSLALAYRADYARANVPMLPVIASPRRASFWMLAHATATALFGLLIALRPAMGWVYFAPVALASLWLLRESAMLLTEYTGPRAIRVFKVTNIYLSIVLLAICVAAVA